MDDLEIWVPRSTQVKCKDGFELAAYGFLFAPNLSPQTMALSVTFFEIIKHFHLHGKPYSDPQFWGF